MQRTRELLELKPVSVVTKLGRYETVWTLWHLLMYCGMDTLNTVRTLTSICKCCMMIKMDEIIG